MTPLAKELMEDLELATENTLQAYVTTHLDTDPDLTEDEEGCPVSGDTVALHGKHKKLTFREIYREKKGYASWVRSHVDKTFTPPMKQLRLYVEYVDTQKKKRIEQKWSMKQAAGSSQMPVPPTSTTTRKTKEVKKDNETMDYQQAVNHAAGAIMKRLEDMNTNQAPRRRPREGSGWLKEMATEQAMEEEECWEIP